MLDTARVPQCKLLRLRSDFPRPWAALVVCDCQEGWNITAPDKFPSGPWALHLSAVCTIGQRAATGLHVCSLLIAGVHLRYGSTTHFVWGVPAVAGLSHALRSSGCCRDDVMTIVKGRSVQNNMYIEFFNLKHPSHSGFWTPAKSSD